MIVVPGETRSDAWLRRLIDVALVVTVVLMVALLAWTVIRLDARGERLDDALATRQAGCVCPTPGPLP